MSYSGQGPEKPPGSWFGSAPLLSQAAGPRTQTLANNTQMQKVETFQARIYPSKTMVMVKYVILMALPICNLRCVSWVMGRVSLNIVILEYEFNSHCSQLEVSPSAELKGDQFE